MIYDFKDTSKNDDSKLSYPSEAMNYNGYFLEDLIDGYRTLSVSGREGLSTKINSFSIGTRFGEWVSTTTLPARTLTIRYQLLADTPQDMMRKWWQLNDILTGDYGAPDSNAEIYFNDDKEMLYYGIRADVGDAPEGRLNVTSSFTIFCGDPLKYGKTKANDIRWGSTSIDFTAHYRLGNSGGGAFNQKITGNSTIAYTVEGKATKPQIKIVGSGNNVVLDCDGKKINVGTFASKTIEIDTESFVAYIDGDETIIDMDDFYLMPGKVIKLTGSSMNFVLTIDFRNVYL